MTHNTIWRLEGPNDTTELVIAQDNRRNFGAPSGLQLGFLDGRPYVGLLPQEVWEKARQEAPGEVQYAGDAAPLIVGEYPCDYPRPRAYAVGFELDHATITAMESWLADAKARLPTLF